jgi:hypothetical protein
VLYRRHGYRSRAAQAFVTILRALAQTIAEDTRACGDRAVQE